MDGDFQKWIPVWQSTIHRFKISPINHYAISRLLKTDEFREM
jgi:hypothetical protein